MDSLKHIFIKLLLHFALLAAITMQQGCNSASDDSYLENALILAGSNRTELENVLNHYADDSLKLEAAKFLISNMPGHYSYADTSQVNSFYNSVDSLISVLQANNASHLSIKNAIDSIYEIRNADHFQIIPDIRIITADFLIENIDEAFRQWHEIPWARHIDFDSFCEYLLPYKVNEFQAFDHWRKDYAPMFADSLKRMSSCSLFAASSYQATEVINHYLIDKYKSIEDEYTTPVLNYRPITRINIPFGNCDEMCRAGLSLFRAAGVPCVIDNVPLWGYGNRGHSWAVLLAPTGKDIPFVPIFMSPTVQHKVNETISKAYRSTYAINRELQSLNTSGEWVPLVFRNIFQHDVTPQYADIRDITLDIPETCDNKYVYLCGTSRDKWSPIAYAEVKKGKASFKNIGKGCVYIATAYDSRGNASYLTPPIKIDRNGDVSFIIPEKESSESATLYRKVPLLEYAWRMAVMMENGTFEVSNDPSFNNYTTIGHVKSPADRAGEISVSADKYRYWRYIQRGDSAQCYVGELALFNQGQNITKTGIPIGTYPKGISGGKLDGASAFDGNVLSSFSITRPREAWVGLDFGKPVSIDKIIYTPRSDGDMIEPGHLYELTYWDNNRWQSLGKQKATGVSIVYNNIPKGALLILKNLTTNGSVRIFTLNENGDQHWW